MKPTTKTFRLINKLGLPAYFRKKHQKKSVTIVLLHNPSVETARIIFSWLSEHYTFISLKQYLNTRLNLSNEPLPDYSMVVTFDDGMIENYQLLSLFKEFKIHPTIFLCTAIIGTNRHFWFTENNTPLTVDELKKLPNSERELMMKDHGFNKSMVFDTPQVLQDWQIIEMAEQVDFQCHTMHHPILTNCNKDELFTEIGGTKRTLEAIFNKEAYALAYPNGDYGIREQLSAFYAGFKCALTLDAGQNTMTTNPFALYRFSINDSANTDELAAKSSGVWIWLKERFGFRPKATERFTPHTIVTTLKEIRQKQEAVKTVYLDNAFK